jgi:hypothetical protein
VENYKNVNSFFISFKGNLTLKEISTEELELMYKAIYLFDKYIAFESVKGKLFRKIII